MDKLEEKRRDEEEAKNKAKDRKRQKRLAAENLPMVRGTQSITFHHIVHSRGRPHSYVMV